MRSRRTDVDHSEAVARRLALLNAELGAQPPDGVSAVEWAGPTRISGTPWPDEEDEAFVRPPGRYEEGVASDGAGGPTVAGGTFSRGRHAAPRARRWSGLLSSVPVWNPGQVSVILAGLVLALAVTCGWVVMGRGSTELVDVTPVSGRPTAPTAVGTLAAPSSGPGAGAGSGATGATSPIAGADPAARATRPPDGTQVVVHVAGKVRRPGIVVLPAGARVADAVKKAGGVRGGADTSAVNLARVLVDGEQVLIGVKGAMTLPGPAVAPGSGSTQGSLVNVNSADQALLETLPGVGPVMAGGILEWRTTHGGFASVNDLLEVKGIGEATLARLTPLITL